MTFQEMRRLSFLRFLDAFTKSPATLIMAVFFKLTALGLVLLLTRELLDSDSIWGAVQSCFAAIRRGGERTSSKLLTKDLTLLDLNGRDFYSLSQSFLGVLILGGIGTGKTSAVGRNTMIAKLLAGYGGLFLCVKTECRELYLRWCEAAGRLDDVIVFSVDSHHTFNFLDYVSKLQRDMQLVMEDVLFCLTSIMDALARKGAHEDRFFREAALSVFRAILTVLYIVEGKLELGSIYQMLTSLPRSLSERDPENNYCLKMLQEAWRLAEGTPLEDEMRRVMSYLLDFWPSLAVETRESIRASALMVIAELCHDPLFTRFGTTTTVSPDDILDHGKIVIVDWPTHESPRSGLVALVLWKVMFQRATLAKRGKK